MKIKIIAVILAIIAVLNLILSASGKLSAIWFWSIAAILAVIAYKTIPSQNL